MDDLVVESASVQNGNHAWKSLNKFFFFQTTNNIQKTVSAKEGEEEGMRRSSQNQSVQFLVRDIVGL